MVAWSAMQCNKICLLQYFSLYCVASQSTAMQQEIWCWAAERPNLPPSNWNCFFKLELFLQIGTVSSNWNRSSDIWWVFRCRLSSVSLIRGRHFLGLDFLAVPRQLYSWPCHSLTHSLLDIVEKHYHTALWETCDRWDMWWEWWGDMTWQTKRQWQRQWQWQWQWQLENTLK